MGNTMEEKSWQAQTASSQASLDKLAREVVSTVLCTLECFFAYQFDQDSSSNSSEILERPRQNLSHTEPQPSQTLFAGKGMEEGQGLPRAPEQHSLEASKGAKLPVFQPLLETTAADASPLSHTTARQSIQKAVSRAQQRRAKGAGYERAIVPEVLGTVKKAVGKETKSKRRALANTRARRSRASGIADSALQRNLQPGPALSPKPNSPRGLAKPPRARAGKESYSAADTLPSLGPQFSR